MNHDDFLLVAIIAAAIRAGTPILLATLGEIIAERAGVQNVGLEGMMLAGALSGFVTYRSLLLHPWFCSASEVGTQWCLLGGVIVAMLCGGILALAHAFLSITARANQVVSGLAITIFGAGVTSFIGKVFVGIPATGFPNVPIPLLSAIPVIGPGFFSHNVLVYVSYLLVPLIWFYFFRTKAGLHLRSIGENPRAADVMGINVTYARYCAVVKGGMLCGLAGAYLSLAYTPGWTDQMSGGRGWIAIAIVIFSGWNPLMAAFGAYLFGGISGIQMRIQAAGALVPTNLLLMLPYIFTIVVLIISTRGIMRRIVSPPAALGLPYNREER
ncbi:MAG: ABC transporter permease [Candidatus Xenobiia bacterium LiM19]